MKIQSLIQHLLASLFSVGLLLCNSASSVSADEGDTLSTATPIVPGTRSATLTAGDVDWFKFTVTQTGRVGVYSQGYLDTSGAIFNRVGEQLHYDDQGGFNHNFFMNVQLTPETYYIRVRSGQFPSGTKTGDYSITLLTQETAPLITGAGFAGELSLGSADFYRIPVEQVGLFEVYTTGTTDTYGVLYNEVGAKFIPSIFDENSGANNINFHIDRERVQPSTYLLMIKGGGAYSYSPPAAGPYEAFILRPGLAEDLTSSPLDRNLDPLGDIDHFTFVVPKYGKVRLWSTGTTDTQCRLYDSVGVAVPHTYNDNGGDGYNFHVQTTLQPGRYYLRVSGNAGGNPKGPYRVYLELPHEVDRAAPSIRITSPAQGKRVGRRFILRGSASDNSRVTRVDSFWGRGWKPAVFNGFSWSSSIRTRNVPGRGRRFSVSVQATDASGNSATTLRVFKRRR